MHADRRPIAAVVIIVALAAATATAGTTVVKVRAADAERLPGIGLAPLTDLDYGSFRWLELTPSDAARLEGAGIAYQLQPNAHQVRINGVVFDPLVDGVPAAAEGLDAPPADGVGFRLVQLIGPATDVWLGELATAGLRVLQYYPFNTYLVWSGPAPAEAAARLDFVRWIGAVLPAWKPAAGLLERSGRIADVELLLLDEGGLDKTVASLTELGAVVLHRAPAQPDRAFWSVWATLDSTRVADAARLAPVLWLGYQSPQPGLDDEMSDQIIAGNHPGGVPVTGYQSYLGTLGYDGGGVIWSITDTGVDYTHPDLNTRIVGGHNYPGCVFANPGDDPSSGGHGTHVAGIIGGDASGGFSDANGFLYGLGVAPGYSIFAQNPICGSQSSWPPAGGWQELSKQGVLGSAIGANNSWTSSEGTAHGYQATERTHDFMVRDGNFDTPEIEPYVIVFSAGNSGPGASTLTSPKEAKNVIVTAGTQNYRVGSIDSMYSSSSRGPTVDGRYGPTIATPGQQIASTRNNDGGSCGTAIPGTNNLYSFCTGTSMAAPHASGSIVLATEWWRDSHGGATPSPAMARALLVNGAVDMATPDVPNFNEGWGRVNVDHIIRPAAMSAYRDQDDVLAATGESFVWQVGVADPTQPLKITLAWSDAPGAVGTNPALVNDLDLSVAVDGASYLGNVFNGGWSTTGGAADGLNNLENVYLPTVTGGTAVEITVDAAAIGGDGVPGNADITDQDFALVCFNCIEQPDFTLGATPEAVSVCAPDDAEWAIEVGSLLGYTDPVTLLASGLPVPLTASFSTNPVTPPGSSTLTISLTGLVAPVSGPFTLVGNALTRSHSRELLLTIASATPTGATLTTPAAGATNVSQRPTFDWIPDEQAETFRLEVATDAAFTELVIDETAIGQATFTPPTDLATNTRHWWRVSSSNACGDGAVSPTFEFVTLALPGECGLGSVPVEVFFDDLESGPTSWTTGGSGSTWQLSAARTHSGTAAYWADDVSGVSDQQLMTGDIVLPAAMDALTLQLWSWQEIEDRAGGCYDGGVVEILPLGAADWIRLVPDPATDPYDGPVSSTSANPLAGDDTWCGDPHDWTRAVVDVAPYAGETVRFRFRLGTDSSVGHEGWYLDDVKVQGCAPDDPTIFADDFESGDTSAWSAAVGGP